MLLNAIARFLWLSGKKSRRRIAGSPTVGGWSEALFYGLLFFLGLIALALFGVVGMLMMGSFGAIRRGL